MPKFSGGVYEDDKGYLRISAGKHRGVRVATLVAEAMLGRKLKPDEDVHHKDEDKLNPEWSNLEVLSHKEHGAVTRMQHQFLKRKEKHDREQWESYEEQSSNGARAARSSGEGDRDENEDVRFP